MRKALAIAAVFGALTCWCATQAYASPSQAQTPVEITAGPNLIAAGPNATVTWTTSVPSSAIVRYGTSPNNLNQQAEQSWGGPNHSVTITRLQPGQTYYYQVVVNEAQGTGTAASSPVEQFVAGQQGSQTLAQNQVRITAGPTVLAAGPNATFTWTTDVPSSAIVKYGTNPNNLDHQAEQSWGGPNHSVTIIGLQPGQRYYYQIISGEGQGTGSGAMSGIGQFVAGQGQQGLQP